MKLVANCLDSRLKGVINPANCMVAQGEVKIMKNDKLIIKKQEYVKFPGNGAYVEVEDEELALAIISKYAGQICTEDQHKLMLEKNSKKKKVEAVDEKKAETNDEKKSSNKSK